MMRLAALTLLLLPALPPLGGCASAPELVLRGDRPGDFTLGLVVYHDQAWDDAAQRPARYIVEPDGTLRASVGDGSAPLTHPPITRRLGQAQLDALWATARSLAPTPQQDKASDELVRSPETYAPPRGAGYLVEVRSRDSQGAWALAPSDENARALAAQLAELAWVRP